MRTIAWAMLLATAAAFSLAEDIRPLLIRSADTTRRSSLVADLPRSGWSAHDVIERLRAEADGAIAWLLDTWVKAESARKVERPHAGRRRDARRWFVTAEGDAASAYFVFASGGSVRAGPMRFASIRR